MKLAVMFALAVIVAINDPLGRACQAQPVRRSRTSARRGRIRVACAASGPNAGRRSSGSDATRPSKSLIELGEAVAPLLPEITPETSAETKERLTRIRSTLDQVALTAAMQPSRVTIEGEFTLSEILAKFQQQTGNHVIDFRNRFGQQASDAKLSVEYQNMAFLAGARPTARSGRLDNLQLHRRTADVGHCGRQRQPDRSLWLGQLRGRLSRRGDGDSGSAQPA